MPQDAQTLKRLGKTEIDIGRLLGIVMDQYLIVINLEHRAIIARYCDVLADIGIQGLYRKICSLRVANCVLLVGAGVLARSRAIDQSSVLRPERDAATKVFLFHFCPLGTAVVL